MYVCKFLLLPHLISLSLSLSLSRLFLFLPPSPPAYFLLSCLSRSSRLALSNASSSSLSFKLIYDCIPILSLQLSCQIFKLMRWWDLLMACRYVSFYLSSLSLSLSLPLLSYRLVCLTNSLPSSLYSCPLSLFLSFVLYLSSYSSLSPLICLPIFFCSSAFKFMLI